MENTKPSKVKLSDNAGIKVAIFIVIFLVGINSLYIYGKLGDLDNNKQRTADIIEFREQLDMIFETVQKSDLGMRGFFINHDDGMLTPHLESLADQKRSLEILIRLFDKYGLETDDLKAFMQEVKEYIELNSLLIDKIRQGDMDFVIATVKEDPGFDLWIKYTEFTPGVLSFLDNLNQASEAEYRKDVVNTILVQILFLVIGIPALFIILSKINSSKKQRQDLFQEIDRNGREYVFDNHVKIDGSDEKGIIYNLKANLAEASRFVKEITVGNYEVNWESMNKDLEPFNTDNLAGNMIKMRDHMKAVKIKDDQHLWSVNGLAKFADIIRDNMHDLGEFSGKIVSNLVKYLGANQAAFFVVNEEQEMLDLKGCFAYDRKKYESMSIHKGQGLAGQCWLEKELLYLKQVPANYVRITSGLGEETPTNLIITPVMAEDQVMGIIEIASFTEYEPYKIDFIDKLSASIGSSLAMIKVNDQANRLLQESKEMSERLRSQEEELLQNSEELQATQEELQRKLKEAELKLRATEAAYGKIVMNEEGRLAMGRLN